MRIEYAETRRAALGVLAGVILGAALTALVQLAKGGVFAKLLGCEAIRVNSLHGQGILELGKRVAVEGVAEDGTIEAIRIAEAPCFALGVQWHAEYDPQSNPINRILFEAFGTALSQSRHVKGNR